jgi:YebC/PmpR family DNA-binding regulatory protein
MSGHSKWAQIKRKKGAIDVKRGKLFSQLTKAITVAARTGQNLEMAVSRARAANMPADTVDRAIKKGTGELRDGVQIESLVYELYGPGGSALLVTVLTDNKNRTLAEIRTICTKLGARLVDSGSVQYLFDRQGVIDVQPDDSVMPDAFELELIDAGASDIASGDGAWSVIVAARDVMTVKRAIEAAGRVVTDARLVNVPKQTIDLSSYNRDALERLVDALESLDDVESVDTNAVVTSVD